ncbi:MAG: ATP-binding protein [Cyanobacteria bacterium P01_F01_bin.53]
MNSNSQDSASALGISTSESTEQRPDAPTHDYPIHLINAIQPHGVLLALDRTDFSIVQVSANTQVYLGLTPEQLLGESLSLLCAIAPIRDLLRDTSPNPAPTSTRVTPIRLTINTASGPADFDSFIHCTHDTIILEMEPVAAADVVPFDPAGQSKVTNGGFYAVYALVNLAIERMQQAETREALLTLIVDEIRQLTGFDRVMVYRFDAQGAGAVVAEYKHPDLEASYLGLNFPAREIPARCRELYVRGKLRVTPHIQAHSVPLLPPPDPSPPVSAPQTEPPLATQMWPATQPLDLSLSVLRSPDACCAEYYSNMGVSAALTASLIKDKQLWGLVACHHRAPKKLSYDIRAACELLVQVASSELSNKVKQEDLEQRDRLRQIQSDLISAMAEADNFAEALIEPEERLLSLVNASGAAICLGKDLTLVGETPNQEQVRSLMDWASEQTTDSLFHTACLSDAYPDAAAIKSVASGLLLLQISKVQHYQILWFRPEVLQTINWGGPPNDGIEEDEQGRVRLGPRQSFSLWQETVQATALPWRSDEIKGAIALKSAIVGIVLKKADELAKLNRALHTSNRELASFAYAAAHDLKEPLRGIYNYANILVEDYATVLDDAGLSYLSDIQVFSQRMETLINALLRIAGLRQTELHLKTVSLDELLENAVDVLRASRPDASFELRRPKSLPQVECDPVLVNEVFRNLISNALKYNDNSEKWVEVGYESTGAPQALPKEPSEDTGNVENLENLVFYIRDNGIGIRQEHLTMVFQLFKRLHPQDRYDGGAGVGLAVVNQIIDRHGGRLWVESVFGEGSTFYFTLG